MNTMRAASISAFGAADNFEIVSVPVPEPAANEVLIQVEVAGLIYADVQLRSGNYPIRDLPLPAIPGHEVVGVIESVGAEIENFEPGMRVSAELNIGGYAEYATTTENRLVELPEGVSFENALVYSYNLPAAYLVYYHFGDISPDATVLVHSGAGGLGGMLTQIAKKAGNTVIALTSDEGKFAACRANGADHVVDSRIDYAQQVNEITGGRGVDVIFNHIAGDTLAADLDSLAFRGFWNFPGHLANFVGDVDIKKLFAKSPSIVRSSMESYLNEPQHQEALDYLYDWLVREPLQGPEHTFPLEQVAEAHRLIESRKSIGKIALRM